MNKIIKELKEKKVRLERELWNTEFSIKAELKKLPFIEGLAGYIKYKEYPTNELHSSFSMDDGEVDYFGKADIKVVYRHGYTCIIGLNKEEFQQLENLLNE